MAPPKKGRPLFPRTGWAASRLCQNPQAFASTTPTLSPAPISTAARTRVRSGPVYIEPQEKSGSLRPRGLLNYERVRAVFQSRRRHGQRRAGRNADRSPATDREGRDEKAQSATKGFEVGYGLFSINGRMLGQGDPIRVKQGERVLFHILNASATEIRSLALPGHVFRVVALDGNPVPTPADVPVLWLGTAERISAIVEMKHPGIWVMGDLADDDRGHGMGIVVEYAGETGKPQWTKPRPFRWDYTRFGKAGATPVASDETIEMHIVKQNAAANGFNQWTLNGQAFSMDTMTPTFTLHQDRRYRLKFRNASDDIHPLHLHRHSFELTRVGGKPTAGVIKDVVMLGGFQEVEMDFVADNPGHTLFHCHQQLHMDFGFMALFKYA